MITITELEFVLFVSLVVVGFMYFKEKADSVSFKRTTMRLFHEIAKGNIKVTETDEGFEMKEIKNAN